MDAEEYSKQASKFFNRKLAPIQVLTNASMGCAGEAGELVDHIKKVAFHGHDLDATHVVKELGDILWYINYAIYALNLLGHSVTLSQVMQINTDKLEARYPNGFSHEASRNRAAESLQAVTVLSQSSGAMLVSDPYATPEYRYTILRKPDNVVLGRWSVYGDAMTAWWLYHAEAPSR